MPTRSSADLVCFRPVSKRPEVSDRANRSTLSKARPDRLSAEERRREIQQVLIQNGRITVEEVGNLFDVSLVTARGDLDALSATGALIRSHGGGIRPLAPKPEVALHLRRRIHREEKLRIARAARKLIRPWQTIVLGSGSTLAELAALLREDCPPQLTVITYALPIACILSDVANLSLIVAGGIVRSVSGALLGPHTEQMMASLHAEHCFLGTVGLNSSVGLTTLDIMEAQLNQHMIRSAKEVTVLADSSKFQARSLAPIAGVDSIQRVITNSGAPPDEVAKFRERGVEVQLV